MTLVSPRRKNVPSSVKSKPQGKLVQTERYCKSLLLLKAAQLGFFPPSPTCSAASFARRSIHSSESQQEFFRMLDEKIEKVRKDGRVLNQASQMDGSRERFFPSLALCDVCVT